MKKKVGLLGIYHESNTFLKHKTSLADFKNGHLLYGEEISREYSQAFHQIGGMLERLKESKIDAVPLVFAEATPGGAIRADALDYLWAEMAAALSSKGPFDGMLVAVHGAAVSESQSDMDGWWLQRLRSYLGEEKPITGTLDPHANVSQRMIDATDTLVAYSTNPHIDQRETGTKAAQIMIDCLEDKVQPVQYFFQPDATISIEQQCTNASPCRELYNLASQISEKPNILSVSILLGFPYADVSEMGSGFLVVTDHDNKLAEHSAKRLGDYLWKNRGDFVGEKISVKEAIAKLAGMPKPVLLLDMGDNVGGGSPGDSTFILQGLENSGDLRSFLCMYDPEAVMQASESGTERRIWMKIGGKTDKLHGNPCKSKVTVKTITEGVFKENKPRHGGQVNFNMGKTAIVETDNDTTIMLTSRRTVPFSLNQLTSFGIDPGQYDAIVAKGVHAPIAAYQAVCNSFIQVNTKGITRADLTKLSFFNRRKPLYPFEKI